MKNMVEKETIERPNVKKQALELRSTIGSVLKYTALCILSFYFHFSFCLDGFGNDEYTRGYHIGKNKDWQ